MERIETGGEDFSCKGRRFAKGREKVPQNFKSERMRVPMIE